jgi:ATP-dependent helicase/nuclease subunit B
MLELIGLQENLVSRTCERVLEHRDGNDLSSVAVIFPSKRFGFFLRHELSRSLAGNFFPPALFPVEAFFESLFKLNFPGRRILGDLEAAHAVYETAATVFHGGMYGSRQIADFTSFLPWAQKILAALEEILIEDGRLEGINWEEYGEFAQLGSYHAPYKDFIRKIPELLAALGTCLQGRKQATKGMACREVAGLARDGGLRTPPAKHWIFSGFNAVNSCERKLFRFFIEKRGAGLILRTDPIGLKDARSPFHLQTETILGLGMKLPHSNPISSAWNDLAGRVTLHPCAGVENEVFLAFRMLEDICRGRDEAALRKIAVLLPSSSTLIPFVQGTVSRFDQEKNRVPFNITLGYPLERTPMMQLVDSLLAVLEKTRDGRIEAGDYLQLIRHPYIKISGGGGDREPLKRGIHLLEDLIREQNLTRFTVNDLKEKFSAEVKRAVHGIGAELGAEIETQVDFLHQRFLPVGNLGFQSLLVFLRRALESVCRKDTRQAFLFLNEYAAATLKALEELEDFASTHEQSLEHAGAADMAALVRGHFRGCTISFEGSPLQGVQVMGPLEFRGLSFDEVLVLDALEGILPGTAKYDPILPADIRAIFRIRDHGDWEKIYAFNFFAMLGAASRVHIFYSRKNADGQDCERSRFIERIVYEVEKKTGRAPETATSPMPFSIRPRELKRVKKTAAILARMEALSISPSSLESFVRCPLQFYFSRVLHLQEREEVAAETDGGLIGTIAHEVLGAFYGKYNDADVMRKAGEKTLEADLEGFLSAAFRKLNFDPAKGLERIRAWTLLEQLRLFIREDRQRMEENGIRVEKREEGLSMALNIPGTDSPIRIKGRLDRRETEGKLLRVVDYKTGSYFNPKVRSQTTLDLEDLSKLEEKEYFAALGAFRKKYPGMQLHMYLMLLAQEKGKPFEELDAAYVFLRAKGNRMLQGIFMTGGRDAREFASVEKRDAMDAFVNDLGEVLRDLFAREYFLPDPGDEKVCAWCPFRLPCGNL